MELRPSPKFSVRKILVWIALLMAVAFVVVSITELENIVHALQRGNWLFLLLAVALQLLCLANNALTYRAVYRLVGLQESWRYLLLLSTAFTFVNMIAPSGGVGGVAVFVDSAKQRNQSPARAMVVGILYAIYEYISLLIVIFAGFIIHPPSQYHCRRGLCRAASTRSHHRVQFAVVHWVPLLRKAGESPAAFFDLGEPGAIQVFSPRCAQPCSSQAAGSGDR